MKKIAYLLALLLAASVFSSGCGGNNDGNNVKGDDASEIHEEEKEQNVQEEKKSFGPVSFGEHYNARNDGMVFHDGFLYYFDAGEKNTVKVDLETGTKTKFLDSGVSHANFYEGYMYCVYGGDADGDGYDGDFAMINLESGKVSAVNLCFDINRDYKGAGGYQIAYGSFDHFYLEDSCLMFYSAHTGYYDNRSSATAVASMVNLSDFSEKIFAKVEGSQNIESLGSPYIGFDRYGDNIYVFESDIAYKVSLDDIEETEDVLPELQMVFSSYDEDAFETAMYGENGFYVFDEDDGNLIAYNYDTGEKTVIMKLSSLSEEYNLINANKYVSGNNLITVDRATDKVVVYKDFDLASPKVISSYERDADGKSCEINQSGFYNGKVYYSTLENGEYHLYSVDEVFDVTRIY